MLINQEKPQEKLTIKQRILQYIDYKGISEYKFYRESGVTRGVLTQKSGISEDNIAKFIAYAPDINLDWLLTGTGEMIKQDAARPGVEAPQVDIIQNQPQKDEKFAFLTNDLMDKIVSQALEIGRLQERLAMYERMFAHSGGGGNFHDPGGSLAPMTAPSPFQSFDQAPIATPSTPEHFGDGFSPQKAQRNPSESAAK